TTVQNLRNYLINQYAINYELLKHAIINQDYKEADAIKAKIEEIIIVEDKLINLWREYIKYEN
ncbi:hypothetical protein Q604_UNBC16484G0001, partial [human gut metagenome]